MAKNETGGRNTIHFSSSAVASSPPNVSKSVNAVAVLASSAEVVANARSFDENGHRAFRNQNDVQASFGADSLVSKISKTFNEIHPNQFGTRRADSSIVMKPAFGVVVTDKITPATATLVATSGDIAIANVQGQTFIFQYKLTDTSGLKTTRPLKIHSNASMQEIEDGLKAVLGEDFEVSGEFGVSAFNITLECKVAGELTQFSFQTSIDNGQTFEDNLLTVAASITAGSDSNLKDIATSDEIKEVIQTLFKLPYYKISVAMKLDINSLKALMEQWQNENQQYDNLVHKKMLLVLPVSHFEHCAEFKTIAEIGSPRNDRIVPVLGSGAENTAEIIGGVLSLSTLAEDEFKLSINCKTIGGGVASFKNLSEDQREVFKDAQCTFYELENNLDCLKVGEFGSRNTGIMEVVTVDQLHLNVIARLQSAFNKLKTISTEQIKAAITEQVRKAYNASNPSENLIYPVVDSADPQSVDERYKEQIKELESTFDDKTTFVDDMKARGYHIQVKKDPNDPKNALATYAFATQVNIKTAIVTELIVKE